MKLQKLEQEWIKRIKKDCNPFTDIPVNLLCNDAEVLSTVADKLLSKGIINATTR